MSIVIEETVSALRETLAELRPLVETGDAEKIRTRPDDTTFSVHERIVGLFKYETEYLRPALALLLGQEMRRLPTFDLAERATQGGYAAYKLPPLLAQWAEARNVSIAMIEGLDASFLAMRGEMPDCAITVAELLEQWVAHEAEQRHLIAETMSGETE